MAGPCYYNIIFDVLFCNILYDDVVELEQEPKRAHQQHGGCWFGRRVAILLGFKRSWLLKSVAILSDQRQRKQYVNS